MQRETQIYSDEEIRKIFTAIKQLRLYGWERDALAIHLCLKLGLRIGECVRLKRQDIDFNERKLYIRNSKRGRIDSLKLKDRHIPILKNYLNDFDYLISQFNNYLFFPISHRNQKNHINENTIRQRFYLYLKHANIDKQLNLGWGNGKAHKKTLHDTRRTFVSKLVEKNPTIPLHFLSQVSRNSPEVLRQFYWKVNKDKVQDGLDY